MASFENTVIIQRPVKDVFAFLADFENVPAWNNAIVQTTKASPGPGGSDLPPDPIGAQEERGGLQGDRLRAAEPTRGAGGDRALHGQGALPARPDGQRDKADKRRGPGILGVADPGYPYDRGEPCLLHLHPAHSPDHHH
jgi:Polyketide cyclase / dehydrase and lipid transport